MTPEQYDAWYHTARGRWIGETEFRLISDLLEPEPGSRILDVGCGTGYFTRRFANEVYEVTGLDPDPAMLVYARAHRTGMEDYILGDGCRLPFSDGPSGGTFARSVEAVTPHWVSFGGFVAAAARSGRSFTSAGKRRGRPHRIA
jgi:SAM-dependent methyltransferase